MLFRTRGLLWCLLWLMLFFGADASAWSLQQVPVAPATVATQLPDSHHPGRNLRLYYRLDGTSHGARDSAQQYLVLLRDRGQRLWLWRSDGQLLQELSSGAAADWAQVGVRGAALPLPAESANLALYVVIDSVLGVQPRLTLESANAYHQQELRIGACEVSLGSALIMLIMLSLAFSLILREPGYLAYVGFLLLMLLAIALRHPLIFRSADSFGMTPEQIAALGVLVSTFAAFAAVTLLRAASGIGTQFPRGGRNMQWIALVGIVLGLIDFAVIESHYSWAQLAFDGVNLSFGANALLSAALLLATAWTGGRTARLFLLGWIPMVLIGGWFSVGGFLGLAQSQSPHRWVMLACVLQGIGWAIALGDRALSLQRDRDRAWALAELDSLTGLPNRRMLDRELAKARSGWLLICDLDGFKAVNDRFGHDAGDRFLKHFAECLREALTDAMVYGRYGGEEFLAILPGGDHAQARLIAERLRERTAGTPLRVGEHEHQLTVSIGIAELDPADPKRALRTADSAMYKAKAGGRNRVEMVL